MDSVIRVRVDMQDEIGRDTDGGGVQHISERIEKLRSVQDEVDELTSLIEGPHIPKEVHATINVEEPMAPNGDDRVIVSISGAVREFNTWLDTLYEATDWERFEIQGRELKARARFEL